MKYVTVLLIVFLLFASTDAQSLRRGVKNGKKKAEKKKLKLKKLAQAPLKNGGGTFKVYQGPDDVIFATAKFKGGDASSGESPRPDTVIDLSELDKEKEAPSVEQVWKKATGKKVPKELKAATRRHLEAKKKKKQNSDSSDGGHEKADAPVSTDNCPSFFWNANDCSATAKNVCFCRKTGNARFDRSTDYLHTTVYPYRGSLVHSHHDGARFLYSQFVAQNEYGGFWSWLNGPGETVFNARLTAAVNDGWHFSIKWGS